jgi:Fe-S-cluster containining protein
MQKTIIRIGKCVDCGDCCILYVNGNYKRCVFYDLTTPKHCMIYDGRPQVCKDFPRVPADLLDKPICGFEFVDEKGRKIDGYQDSRTRLRLINAINKLKQKGKM